MVQSLAQEGRQKDKIVAAAHWSEGALERAEELLTIEEVQNSRHLALRCLLMLWRESPRIASECLRIVER
ncbi:hypothetical protein, partial [Pseudomonas sp. MPR-TSA4]|uniref:hypothetical protein n=1 Tax=Pseudomonas sp. MPR-TSA4 TaxID=2070594 RepID=UPI001C46D2D8